MFRLTAKTFLASSTFLEILKGFGDGELEPEVILVSITLIRQNECF